MQSDCKNELKVASFRMIYKMVIKFLRNFKQFIDVVI